MIITKKGNRFNFNEALKMVSLLRFNERDNYISLRKRTDCFDMNATEPCIQTMDMEDQQLHEFPYDYLINEFNKGNLEFYGLVKMEVKND